MLLVSAVQQGKTAIIIHMSPRSWTLPRSPPSPSHPSRSSQHTWLSSLCRIAAFPLASYFTHGSLCMSVLLSQFGPILPKWDNFSLGSFLGISTASPHSAGHLCPTQPVRAMQIWSPCADTTWIISQATLGVNHRLSLAPGLLSGQNVCVPQNSYIDTPWPLVSECKNSKW